MCNSCITDSIVTSNEHVKVCAEDISNKEGSGAVGVGTE